MGPQDAKDVTRDTACNVSALVGEVAALKADATYWLTDPEYAALRHRLEAAHAAAEAALVEARPTADCDDLDPLARVSPWLRAYTRLWSTTGRRLPVLLMVRICAFEVYRTTLPG
jgi:hypothetical protein